jgi:glycosyltransferase involved in cell wall biosynthesis
MVLKKKAGSQKKGETQHFPFVSVCTPTFNRRPFIENMFQCFRNQDYPKSRIEWIIVDDGTDKIKDLVDKSGIPQIKYFAVDKKMTLGAKRNYMHSFSKGSILVYMDDDDYYPPERISHAVERLQSNPGALCAGSSEIYIYFKGLGKMVQCGPYGPNHATAGTFAFRRELLDITKYEDSASLAEEKAFLKEYTIPFVQLDPMKSILVFSHEHNTFDKRKMLDNPHPDFFKESPKTVDMFIRHSDEKPIRDFFMENIDGLLLAYEPGLPKMKPDVLKQLKEIEESRNKMIEEEMAKRNANGPICITQPDGTQKQLTSIEIVQLLQNQQAMITTQKEEIDRLNGTNKEFTELVISLQNQIVVLKDVVSVLPPPLPPQPNVEETEVEEQEEENIKIEEIREPIKEVIKEKSKSDPQVFVNIYS